MTSLHDDNTPPTPVRSLATKIDPDQPLNKGKIWGAIKGEGLIAQLQRCTEMNLPSRTAFSVLWERVKDTPILTWLHKMGEVPRSDLQKTEACLVSFLEANGATHAACVVKFLTQPELPTSVPLVEEFLKDALRQKLKDIRQQHSDTAHCTSLIAYLDGLDLSKNDAAAADQRAASRAVAADIEALPERYRARADVLFATTLKDTVASCAALVWKDAARQEEAVNGFLEGIGTYSGETVLLSGNGCSSEGNNSSNTPQPGVSFEELDKREWPSGFVKTDSQKPELHLRYTGETNDTMQIGKETKIMLLVFRESLVTMAIGVGTSFKAIDRIFQTTKELDVYLEFLVKPIPNFRPALPPLFDSVDYDSGAVAFSGGPAPPMLQPDKQGVSLVQGDSGTGKTTFACHTLPKKLARTNPIVCRIVIESNNTIEQINNAHEDHVRALKDMDEEEGFRRLCCLAAMRWRSASLPDEGDYKAWRLYCITKLRADSRDNLATDFVIEALKKALKSNLTREEASSNWFDNTGVPKAGSVVLVVDEIGKSLALARAIISARYEIFTHEWVLSHLTSLDLVLCGTGAEMSLPTPCFDLPVATDPSAVHRVEMTTPTEPFANKMFTEALNCSTLDETKKKAPMLYAQYMSSPLFSAAKDNIRLFLLTCNILRFMWRQAVTGEDPPDRVAHVDATLASSIGLDRIATLALLIFPNYNGLKRAGMNAKRAMDATLVEALADTSRGNRYRTVIPVMELQQHKTWLNKAATLGLVVRKPGNRPSAAMTALVAFAYSSPGGELEGYALEKFTAQWASRLVQVQCGYTLAPRQLECNIPWKSSKAINMKPSGSEIRELVSLLAKHRVLVMVNGPNAPGADVIVLQLRPSYSEVSDQMTLEGYKSVWRKGVMAFMTLISAKRQGESFRRQLEGMGVLGENRGEKKIDRSIGPVLLACLCALAAINDNTTITDDFISLIHDETKTPYNQLSKELTLFLTGLLKKVEQNTKMQDEAVYTNELQGEAVDRKLAEDTGVKILVRPCLVYGEENFQSEDLPRMEEVLSDCSWARKDPHGYCFCPPSTFGPLAGCVTARSRHEDN